MSEGSTDTVRSPTLTRTGRRGDLVWSITARRNTSAMSASPFCLATSSGSSRSTRTEANSSMAFWTTVVSPRLGSTRST